MRNRGRGMTRKLDLSTVTEREARLAIVAEAHDWEGTPYAHQHRSRMAVDCIGLIICVGYITGAMEWDEADPRWQKFKNYSYLADPALMKEWLNTFLVHLPTRDDAGLGDIYWLKDEGNPVHLAIISGPRSVIHGYRLPGKVIESPIDADIIRFVAAAWRYPGLAGIMP